jgi:hypothetical protein
MMGMPGHKPTAVTTPSGCVARVGSGMPSWAPRKGDRCGSMPSHFPSISIDSKPVLLPLCRQHYAKLQQSPDRTRLARDWAP